MALGNQMSQQLQQQQMGRTLASGAGSSATAIPSQSANAQLMQQRATWTFTVIIATTGVLQVVPGLQVAQGKSVWLYAKNGAAAGNAKPIFVATYPAALQSAPNSQALALNPGDEIPYAVDNTGAIWVSGTAGDGVVVQVVSNSATS